MCPGMYFQIGTAFHAEYKFQNKEINRRAVLSEMRKYMCIRSQHLWGDHVPFQMSIGHMYLHIFKWENN